MPEPNNVIVPEIGVIFMAVAKCASTSLKRVALDGLGRFNQRKPKEKDSLIGLRYVSTDAAYYTYVGYMNIAICRNPWARLASCWVDKTQDKPNSKFTRYYKPFGLRPGMTLMEFIDVVCKIPDEEADPHFRSQSHSLLAAGMFNAWTHLCRLERIEKDWPLVQAAYHVHSGQWGVDHEHGLGDFPKLHVSSLDGNYRDLFTGDAAEKVARRYAKDIEVFDYEF